MDWRERPFFSWDNVIAALGWAQEENVDLWVCSAEVFDLYQMRDGAGRALVVDWRWERLYRRHERDHILGDGPQPTSLEPTTMADRYGRVASLCSCNLRYHSHHHWVWETAPDRGKAVKVHLGTCRYETLADT